MSTLPTAIRSLVVALCWLLGSEHHADGHAGDVHTSSLSAGSTVANILGVVVIASAFVAIIWLVRGQHLAWQSRERSDLARDDQMRDRISS